MKKLDLLINKDEKNIWIIDPIDGTSNFLFGIPHFAISIALQSHEEIICGLILIQLKMKCFMLKKIMVHFLITKE